jgi:hypothetical protein
VLLFEIRVGRRKGHVEAGLRSTSILADSILADYRRHFGERSISREPLPSRKAKNLPPGAY